MKDTNNFLIHSSCEFIIKTEDYNPNVITEKTHLSPDRQFSKGDIVESKYSTKFATRQYGLWAISSEGKVEKEKDISFHINYLKKMIWSQKPVLLSLKKEFKFTFTFWIWIETDDAGIGFELTAEDISFFQELSCKINVSLICDDKMNEK